jgi:hypothetical protein
MSYVVTVKMVNLDTGQEEELYSRPHSECQFRKWFPYKNYEIQLRLDYNGKPHEAPVLDADIKDTNTGKLIKKGPWHNTEAKHDTTSNTYIYPWKFDGLELRIFLKTTWAIGIGLDVIFK